MDLAHTRACITTLFAYSLLACVFPFLAMLLVSVNSVLKVHRSKLLNCLMTFIHIWMTSLTHSMSIKWKLLETVVSTRPYVICQVILHKSVI